MIISDKWKDYELIDCSSGERLERWGDVIFIRPDPQVIWHTPKNDPRWRSADARYHRSNSGGGQWEIFKKIPDVWSIGYRELRFNIKAMGFKHTGLFPEQAANWDRIAEIIKKSGRELKVLNMFAYTGAATVSALAAGACVTHVDAAKGMVQWAKENAAISGVADKKVRWLVDDCKKFIERETRRGNRYDIIIMDPPSYGRGPGGDVWKLEDEIYELVCGCLPVLSSQAEAFLINSYTTGLSASVMKYILDVTVGKIFGGQVEADELGLPVSAQNCALPCGAAALWRSR